MTERPAIPFGASGTGGGSGSKPQYHGGRGGGKRTYFKPKQPKFEGACEDLKGHVFDCSGYGQADQYVKTQEQIANYAGRTYGGEIGKAVEYLLAPAVDMPTAPTGYGTDNVDPTEKYMWETEVREAIKEKKDLKKQIQKLYAVVIGQCTDSMIARVEAHDDFNTASDE